MSGSEGKADMAAPAWASRFMSTRLVSARLCLLSGHHADRLLQLHGVAWRWCRVQEMRTPALCKTKPLPEPPQQGLADKGAILKWLGAKARLNDPATPIQVPYLG